MKSRSVLFAIFTGLVFTACNTRGVATRPLTQTALPRATSASVTMASTGAASANTPVRPSPTHTPTPVPTPTPHPLTIAWLDHLDFPGSEILIEDTLEPGPNYHRYLTSYQSEGLKIYALMTVPFGEKPETGWPVVVFNHGFIPPAEYRTTERYVAYVDAFARNGYIVFRSDYRGHGSSEGLARGAYSNPDYTIDVLNAVASLRGHPDVDPERVGMWGHSMGGYIALRAMVVSDEIRAGVIWAGVVGPYPNIFVRPTQGAIDGSGNGLGPTPDPTRRRGRWRQALIDLYGTPEENPEFWASISANTYIKDLGGPVQLHHGTADTSVPAAASETLQAQLEAAGMLSELYLYEGDNHNISVNFSAAMQRSIEFFNRHVKGEAD